MRGLSHADWSKILEIKQAGNESFETYAERLWVHTENTQALKCRPQP